MAESAPATILVAEDDRLTVRILQALLGRERYNLTIANTGADALALAIRHKPDLVLLDVGLPDLTGYEVCQRLRADTELGEVPVIMVTALDDRQSKLRGLEVGADDFVSKPFDEVELLARVRTIARLNRYRRLQDAHRLTREMEAAATIQQRLLPAKSPPVPGMQLIGRCRPAAFVGGDYYDFVQHDGAWYFLIGDVSGHGIGSALFMSNARSAVRALLPWIPDLVPLAQALNTRMTDDAGDSGMFISLVIGRLDPDSGRISLVNCGHPPPILLRRDGTVSQLDAMAQPIGMVDDLDLDEVSVVDLDPGDLLLLYTDGLIEARAPDARMFGIERASETLRVLAGQPIEAIADGLLGEITHFTARATLEDDLTLLLVRRC